MNILSNKKILLADTDKFITNFLLNMLEKDGAHTIVAKNYGEFEQNIFYHKPNLIISDIHIGGQDLLSFMKELRNDPWGRSANFFIISEDKLDEDDFFIKEFSEIKPSYLLHKQENKVDEIFEKILEIFS